MRPLDLVLDRAENAIKCGAGWLVSCPLPSHGQGQGDRHPSVSLTEGDDGRALVIPFRFVDGIMKAWQRYSTRR
jgi:hypothetical protein